jgi:hypothetical protein
MRERGIERKLYYCVIVMCIFVLPSCVKRSTKKGQPVLTTDSLIDYQKSVILEKVIQQETMLVNIPIPLYNERILPTSLDSLEKSTIVLGYMSPLTIQQAQDFFVGQMERYGWRHIVLFENVKILLFFENPETYCSILIKPSEKVGSVICIYIKRASF